MCARRVPAPSRKCAALASRSLPSSARRTSSCASPVVAAHAYRFVDPSTWPCPVHRCTTNQLPAPKKQALCRRFAHVLALAQPSTRYRTPSTSSTIPHPQPRLTRWNRERHEPREDTFPTLHPATERSTPREHPQRKTARPNMWPSLAYPFHMLLRALHAAATHSPAGSGNAFTRGSARAPRAAVNARARAHSECRMQLLAS